MRPTIPCDEYQNLLQSLLLENEQIQKHSGGSKALESVKDTEEDALPVVHLICS